MNILFLDKPIVDETDEGLRDLIHSLNEKSDVRGGVIFPASDDFDNVLVIFAGNLERFSMLTVARNIRCKIIYFQDTQSWWYQGSDLLPHLDLLRDGFLVEEIGPLRPVFFGQSSGGYASLVAGRRFPAARVVACAPQVGSDASVKNAIIASHHIACQFTPEGMTNVPDLWSSPGGEGAQAAVIFSVSEWGNPVGSHFWMDYAHALRMLGLENVHVFMMANNKHAIVHRNSRNFGEIIENIIHNRKNITDNIDMIRGALDAMSAGLILKSD